MSNPNLQAEAADTAAAAPTVADITFQIRMRRIQGIKVLKWFHSSFNAVYGFQLKDADLDPLLSTDRMSFEAGAVTTIRTITVDKFKNAATASSDAGFALISNYISNTALTYKSISGEYKKLRTGSQLTRAARSAISRNIDTVDIALDQSSLFPYHQPSHDWF